MSDDRFTLTVLTGLLFAGALAWAVYEVMLTSRAYREHTCCSACRTLEDLDTLSDLRPDRSGDRAP